MIGVLPWNVTFKIFRKTDLQPSEVNLYDKVVIPLLEKSERVVKPPFGKNLFLVAQKK